MRVANFQYYLNRPYDQSFIPAAGVPAMHNFMPFGGPAGVFFFDRSVTIDGRWKQTTFSMIPQTGDPTNPGNWRPLAILNITHKFFSRLVYKRVKPILEAQQSKGQIKFRSPVGVDDAFAVFENVCSKSMEWSVPMCQFGFAESF